MVSLPRLVPALGLVWVTDGEGDVVRVLETARAVIRGGVRTVQLREPKWTALQCIEVCSALRPLLDEVGGILMVNDRADVAAAGFCHGVHLGRHSLPVANVRRFLPKDLIIGFSAHDEDDLRRAREAGAHYVSLSPVLPTSCKPGAAHLGPDLARRWTREAGLPVVWLGGVDLDSLPTLAPVPAAGIAVRSALAASDDPEREAARLCRTFREVAEWTG